MEEGPRLPTLESLLPGFTFGVQQPETHKPELGGGHKPSHPGPTPAPGKGKEDHEV